MSNVTSLEILWAQLASSLLLAGLFVGYWRTYKQRYLRYWALSFVGLCAYVAAVLLATELRQFGYQANDWPMLLTALGYTSAGFFQILALLAGVWALSRQNVSQHRLSLRGLAVAALLLGLLVTLPWADAADGNLYRLFLRTGLRHLLIGLSLLAAAALLWRQWATAPAGQRMVTAVFVLFGAEMTLLGGLSVGYLGGSISPLAAALARQQGLFELVLYPAIGFGLIIWLLATERESAAEGLRASEARLKLTLWGTGDELWDADLVQGSVSRENPIAAFGPRGATSRADAAQTWQRIERADLAALRQAVIAHVKGQSDELDVVYRLHGVDGQLHWLRTRGRVVERNAEGRALRMTGTTSDVTQLKLQEQALAQTNRELEQRVTERTEALSRSHAELQAALDNLQSTQAQLIEQEKLAALGGLVAGVAHEINTPIGVSVTAVSHLREAVNGLLQRIESKRLTRSELDAFAELARESTDLVERNLERANQLIRSFKQVAVDQSSEQKRALELGHYLQDIATSLRPLLKQGGHQLLIDCPAPIELEIAAGAVYQIIANLLQNSVKHGFDGRSGGVITLRAERQGNECLIQYADNGVGMEEAVRRRMFEPFFTTRRSAGGSGLGMHITYNLTVRVLNGKIRCDSVPGNGTRFEISFPLGAAPG